MFERLKKMLGGEQESQGPPLNVHPPGDQSHRPQPPPHMPAETPPPASEADPRFEHPNESA